MRCFARYWAHENRGISSTRQILCSVHCSFLCSSPHVRCVSFYFLGGAERNRSNRGSNKPRNKIMWWGLNILRVKHIFLEALMGFCARMTTLLPLHPAMVSQHKIHISPVLVRCHPLVLPPPLCDSSMAGWYCICVWDCGGGLLFAAAQVLRACHDDKVLNFPIHLFMWPWVKM